MTALVVGLAAAVGLLGILVFGLLRAHAEVLRALHQLGVDMDPSGGRGQVFSTPVDGPVRRDRVPEVPLGVRPTPARPSSTDLIDLTGVTPRGDAISLAVTGVDHDTLVGFLTSGCSTCRSFWDAFRSEIPEVPGGARLAVVTRGPEAESPAAVSSLSGAVSVVMSSEAWEHYDVPYAPYFVYISGPGGRVVGEGVAATWAEVKSLVANAVADGTTEVRDPADGSSRFGLGRARSRADRQRDDAVDRQLLDAGILPGDPRLYPSQVDPNPPDPNQPDPAQPDRGQDAQTTAERDLSVGEPTRR